MSVKFKPKKHKGAVKRIQQTSTGKLKVARVFSLRGHRKINRRRQRLLQGVRGTILSKTWDKLKAII